MADYKSTTVGSATQEDRGPGLQGLSDKNPILGELDMLRCRAKSMAAGSKVELPSMGREPATALDSRFHGPCLEPLFNAVGVVAWGSLSWRR